MTTSGDYVITASTILGYRISSIPLFKIIVLIISMIIWLVFLNILYFY